MENIIQEIAEDFAEKITEYLEALDSDQRKMFIDFLLKKIRKNKKETILTEYEKKVIELTTAGYTNKFIAFKLDVSIHAICYHKKNIYRKKKLNGMADMIRLGIEIERKKAEVKSSYMVSSAPGTGF